MGKVEFVDMSKMILCIKDIKKNMFLKFKMNSVIISPLYQMAEWVRWVII